MKIALVILYADPTRGGAERYTDDLADALARRGHEVTILASDADGSARNVMSLEGRGVTRVGRYRAFQKALSAHLTAVRYDVVHAMLPVLGCDVYHPHAGVAAEAVVAGSRVSRWGNQLNRRRHAMAAAERQLLTSATPPLVLCLSDYLKRTLRRHYPQLDEFHLVRLFNGTDLNRFDSAVRPRAGAEVRQRFSIGEGDTVALMIAQDFERKGLPRTLAALAFVPDPGLKLLVVGKQDPARYRSIAHQLGIADRVIFAGSTSDPIAFYQAADFFVLPTRHDPCSLVVLEALAMGVPVISTVFNGACEVMQTDRHGIVLNDPDDVPALATAFRRLLDPAVRMPMRDACLALRPLLSQETHLETLEAAYARVVAQRATPSESRG